MENLCENRRRHLNSPLGGWGGQRGSASMDVSNLPIWVSAPVDARGALRAKPFTDGFSRGNVPYRHAGRWPQGCSRLIPRRE
jgi:hypothetical protein